MTLEPIPWIRRWLKLISNSVAVGRTGQYECSCSCVGTLLVPLHSLVARSRHACLLRTYSNAEAELPTDGIPDSQVPSLSRQRLLRVAIIGAPNAGKSTLVNGLVGRKVHGYIGQPFVSSCCQAEHGILLFL